MPNNLRQRWQTFLAALAALLIGLGAKPVYDQFAVAGIEVEPEEATFITLLNDYRAQNGLSPVVLDTKLQKAAEAKSQDMINHNYFSHTSSAGETPFDFMCRVAEYCYNAYKGENLGAGYTTAQAMFTGWRTSPGHNSVMLGVFYTATGISRITCSACTYGYYWSNEFGSVVSTPLSTPAPTPKATPTIAPPIATQVNPTPLPKLCPADFNGDRVVNASDFLLFGPFLNGAPYDSRFDLKPDGRIDGSDMLQMMLQMASVIDPC